MRRLREKKKLFWFIVVATCALLAAIALIIYLNVSYAIGEDISITMENEDVSLSAFNSQNALFKASYDTKTRPFCDLECNYSLIDRSNDSIIDSGNSIKMSKDYELKAPDYGEGQIIYNFHVSCKNIETSLCPSDRKPRKKTAFILLNYMNDEKTSNAKAQGSMNFAQKASEMESVIKKSRLLAYHLSDANGELVIFDIARLSDASSKMIEEMLRQFDIAIGLWDKEDYINFYKEVNLIELKQIEGQLSIQEAMLNERIERYNKLIEQMKKLISNKEALANYGILLNSTIVDKTSFQTSKAIDTLNSADSLSGYEVASILIEDANKNLVLIEEDGKKAYGLMISELKRIIAFEDEKLRLAYGAQIIDSGIKDDNFDFSLIEESCNNLGLLQERLNITKTDYYVSITNNITDPVGARDMIVAPYLSNEEFLRIVRLKEQYIEENARRIISKENITLFEFETANDTLRNLPEKFYNLAMDISLSSEYHNYRAKYCSLKKIVLELPPLQRESITLNSYDIVVDGPELEENSKKCCFKNSCGDCLVDKDDNYPILFIHGHSMNEKNSPDYSLNAFNSMKHELGLINAGVLTLSSNYDEFKFGEWGMHETMLMVSGTYYYDIYQKEGIYQLIPQKSENIETYSIRLKELIELLKFRTGKDKVNIVAHSMGGLVARRYLQIFGEESVDNLILIGTPNKGISGKTQRLCPVLGAKKECEDMMPDSVFVGKINDPMKQPKKTKVHTIAGIGCDTDGKDGDGIVPAESVKLDFATNNIINGSCSSIASLHSDLLDPSLYPEVGGILLDIFINK